LAKTPVANRKWNIVIRKNTRIFFIIKKIVNHRGEKNKTDRQNTPLTAILFNVNFITVRKISEGQKKLIAEFLANNGVAWFAGGVIGSFSSWPKHILEAIISLVWGLAFSVGFLRAGLFFMKGVK